jgi:phosphoribosyl 1,2-cyclic phosphodiesterase
MKIKVWGARGSIPVPGPSTVKYGGNTSCLQVTTAAGDLVIFDAGTGIRELGEELAARQGAIKGHIFFTHVHWDHIQGFPFFAPAYMEGSEFYLYGDRKCKAEVEEALAGQMQYPNFPVALEEMTAKMHFLGLEELEEVRIGGAVVSCIRGNHPGGVLLFRVDENGGRLVYATDNEHYSSIPAKLAEFARGSDVLIYDTQFTDDEYSGRAGKSRVSWGHSTIEEGVKLAGAVGAGKLVMWHHDPRHDDRKIEEMEAWARTAFPSTTAAYEGLEIEL